MVMKSIQKAVERWASMDATHWDTGLSPAGVRHAQATAADLIDTSLFRQPGSPPKRLLIWCASNVFTAPLEWVAQFAAMGTKVILKAPSACPIPTEAIAEAFGEFGVVAHRLDHQKALPLLDECDALLAFGSDESLHNLEQQLPQGLPRSLHGHKASLAIVLPTHPEEIARAIVDDAILYDGRGCMSPIAVFCLGEAEALLEATHRALQDQAHKIPVGRLSAPEGAHSRRRIAIARLTGRAMGHTGGASLLMDPNEFEFLALPRLLPIHPIQSLEEIAHLHPLPWSSCATNVAPETLHPLGAHRICKPGELQRPPIDRLHDGIDVIATLCE